MISLSIRIITIRDILAKGLVVIIFPPSQPSRTVWGGFAYGHTFCVCAVPGLDRLLGV